MADIEKDVVQEDKELKDVAWLFGLLAIFSALLIRFFSPVCTLLIFPVAMIAFHQFYWRRRNLPPGPLPLPLVGNTLSIDMRNPAKTFSLWHAYYGPIYTVWLPHPMIVMASHEVLKDALIRNGPAFAGRPCGYVWSMFTKNMEHGDGIILCEGERWEHIREFAHKIFRPDNGIRFSREFGLGRTQMEQKIVHYVNSMVAHIDAKLQEDKQGKLDLEEPISLCVANIIQEIVLGKSYTYGDPQFRKFKNLIDAVASKPVQMVNAYPILAYLPIPALRRFKESGFALQRYFLNIIREHKERLEMDGEPRGMETTVTTLRWGIVYLLYHPTVQRRCYMEIEKIFGDDQPCYAKRKQLPYVEATIVQLIYSPLRFLDENGYFKKRPEMNPFGMGKRTCLGENLARYELFLLFTTLLQKYEFRPIGENYYRYSV
ncbi:unnamed protein product [Nippostrongylus brasiliensis]|uniref:Cytochrome P450 daf-9 (inferred by orthology to a C. elegans protein) n=1 Tax=Nippostrongylus brasiliensis TaxID=27835 RepID=A0A0N4YF52_NIPBR|nr:unnamed protein product [Nippostrongylus brasiliensis]